MKTRTTVQDEKVALEVAKTLIDNEAYLLGFSRPKDDWFVWKSGIVAPVYCNCRKLFANGNAVNFVGRLMTDLVAQQFKDAELIAGLATAGIPWATIVASNLDLPISYVRSQAKAHGVGGMVEGWPQDGLKTVVIDDLCGSGGSMRKGIIALREEYNLDVIGVITITNWQFELMWENFADMDTRILSLTSHVQIVQQAVQDNRITEEQAQMLLEFYDNPKTYNWE